MQHRAAGLIGPAQILFLAGQVAALLLLHRPEMRARLMAPHAIGMAVLLARKHGETLLSENQVQILAD